jgi:hypothetical protein
MFWSSVLAASFLIEEFIALCQILLPSTPTLHPPVRTGFYQLFRNSVILVTFYLLLTKGASFAVDLATEGDQI